MSKYTDLDGYRAMAIELRRLVVSARKDLQEWPTPYRRGYFAGVVEAVSLTAWADFPNFPVNAKDIKKRLGCRARRRDAAKGGGMIHDTEGLLDNCECGARAAFTDTGARCTECAEIVYALVRSEAMTLWNQEMRRRKAKKGGG